MSTTVCSGCGNNIEHTTYLGSQLIRLEGLRLEKKR